MIVCVAVLYIIRQIMLSSWAKIHRSFFATQNRRGPGHGLVGLCLNPALERTWTVKRRSCTHIKVQVPSPVGSGQSPNELNKTANPFKPTDVKWLHFKVLSTVLI